MRAGNLLYDDHIWKRRALKSAARIQLGPASAQVGGPRGPRSPSPLPARAVALDVRQRGNAGKGKRPDRRRREGRRREGGEEAHRAARPRAFVRDGVYGLSARNVKSCAARRARAMDTL